MNKKIDHLFAVLLIISESLTCTTGLAGIDEKFPLQMDLKGPKSVYTEPLLNLVLAWPTESLKQRMLESEQGFALRCLDTPGNPFYIGLEQMMVVDAPLEQTAKVLDDIDSYKTIFPGYAEVKVVQKDSNLWLTEWEGTVPIPFVPNIHYQMNYLIAQPSPARRIYRYQLRKSSDLITSDGVIVLDFVDEKHTQYVEYDFYDAHWGIAKAFGSEKIWRESVEGLALSDLAIKLKAEQPSLDGKQVRKAALRWLKDHKIDVKCGKRAPSTVLFPTLK